MSRKDCYITFRCTESVKSALQDRADAEEKSVGQLIRESLDHAESTRPAAIHD